MNVKTMPKREVWRPEITISNGPEPPTIQLDLEVECQGRGTPVVNGYMYTGQENPLVLTANLKSTVYCDFQLRWYPWDEQHCYVLFKAQEDYAVIECSLRKKPHPTKYLTLVLHLSRRYARTYGLPTSLPSPPCPGKSSSLPSTHYIKHIDVWFVFSLTYLSLIIIVHLATFPSNSRSGNLGEEEDNGRGEEEDNGRGEEEDNGRGEKEDHCRGGGQRQGGGRITAGVRRTAEEDNGKGREKGQQGERRTTAGEGDHCRGGGQRQGRRTTAGEEDNGQGRRITGRRTTAGGGRPRQSGRGSLV
ncbi:putative Gaba-gated chloride channel-like [Homarus americanus]|uniref:Putative Gaba-gated chloride channel-like n=1 Tax=Homarus americanus TaxID=6706 RepID=A0A8J5MW23_HOMAM|nr:putative Gaba-gated chloride channel-like [Homarus americanus]